MKAGDSLYGHHRQSYVLGEEIGSGGEGTVFKTSDPALVAKIYKTPNAKTERKILSMIKVNIEMKSPGGIPLITWPKDILYKNGAFAGYVMPFADGGKPIWNMGRPEGRNKIFHGKYDWSKGLAVAANIASLVAYLHSMGIVIGDMNSNNIFVHPNGFVTIMDVDSFDIRDKDTQEHFKCQVGRPEYLAPELQARRLSEESAAFTEQTDDFALAVHIFQLLFYAHPFNMKMIDRKEGSQGENQQAAAIVEGECPFVKPGNEDKIQPGVPRLSMLPDYLQQDFRETFSYNALNSVQRRGMRIKAAQWYQDLGRLYQEKDRELVRCGVNPEHYYLKAKGCELCRAKRRQDEQNQKMAQWDVQSVCVNRQQADVSTDLDSVSSKEQWYSHYKVNHSPLSMSIPLYVRRTYPNGESTGIEKLPQTYKTGDWISIEGSTQKEEQRKAGMYTIELFDEKQRPLTKNSVRVTEPAGEPWNGGQGQPKPSKFSLFQKYGSVFAMFTTMAVVGVCLLAANVVSHNAKSAARAESVTKAESTTSEPQPTSSRSVETWASQTRAPEPSLEVPQTIPPETVWMPETESSFMKGSVGRNTIRIVNVTGRDIVKICISESTSNSWGQNYLSQVLEYKNENTGSWEKKWDYGYSSEWDLLIETKDGSGWQFLKLDPNLIALGSELQVVYQDHAVFADIASNDVRLDGAVVTSQYVNFDQTAPTQSEYILPDSDRRYYSESELARLTDGELRIARNEIYARHGRKFTDPALQSYFDSCSWYHGTIEASEFDEEKAFNLYEKANRNLIRKMENR